MLFDYGKTAKALLSGVLLEPLKCPLPNFNVKLQIAPFHYNVANFVTIQIVSPQLPNNF